MKAKDQLILALDVPTFEEARVIVETLGDAVGWRFCIWSRMRKRAK